MAANLPTLETARLRLRPFRPADAPDVHRLAGAREIADTTLNIPHPYEDGMAEGWIATHGPLYERGEGAIVAATLAADGVLVGALGLTIQREHDRAELGYWIGLPFWNRGYATEAAAALVDWAFRELRLHRIHATHLARNPRSGRVMEKLGMRHEGVLRQYIRKWGTYEDIVMRSILRSEYVPHQQPQAVRA